MTEHMIVLKDVDKFYDKFHALKNVSLEVDKGQILGYLGPNGSGKTTTIKMILGLVKPSSGNVMVLGEDLYLDSNNALNVKERIGAMLEWDGLYLNLTGFENVLFWAKIYGLAHESACHRVDKLIEKVDLSEWANVLVSKYSHGMKKRLSLARAMVNDPDILILDEPTSGVDLESRIILRKLMKDLSKENKTIFFSSHDLEEVKKISSNLVILNKGRLIFKGSLEEFQKVFGQYEVFVQLKTPEDANILARKLKESSMKLKINGTIVSFTPKKGKVPNLADDTIISSWTVEGSIEDAYLNAISSKEGENV